MWKRLTSLAIAAGLGALPVLPQDLASPAGPPVARPGAAAAKAQFFAGAVTEIDQIHVKVSRNLVGRPNETRSFLIDSNTKMNKTAVKLKARVTVRYRHADNGDIALEIQLRPAVNSKHP